MDDLKPIDMPCMADYFAGELPPDEAAAVERCINRSPDLQKLALRLMRSRIDMSANVAAHIPDLDSQVALLNENVSAALASTSSRNELVSKPVSPVRPKPVSPVRSKPVFDTRSVVNSLPVPRYTAYTIGAFLASLILVFMGWTFAEMRHGVLSPTSLSTYTTGNGERATVTLPDGSSVTLNVGSKLQVPSNFASGNRTVTLSGQAFFSVISHSGAPFTVISGPSITRVLGTQFSVRHYEDDSSATVLVQDGKVSIGSETLVGGQAVSISSHGASPVRHADMNSLSFTKGVLILNNISLLDAIPDLNRWYNVEIRLGDKSFSNREVAGGFEAGSIFDLITVLELMYDARVVKDGRVLTLYR